MFAYAFKLDMQWRRRRVDKQKVNNGLTLNGEKYKKYENIEASSKCIEGVNTLL